MEPPRHDPSGPPASVPELTAAIALGEEAAFTVFHRLYWNRLYGYLMVLTKGNEALAADLAQVTMVRAASRLRKMESEEALWRWLSRVARNAFIDSCRAGGRRPQLVELREGVLAGSQEAFEESPEAALFAALADALRGLTESERVIVEETYLNGRNQAELAGELGLSLKAFESRLFRLRRKLRHLVLTILRDA